MPTIKQAIFGSICDKCKKEILNNKGIAFIAGKDSQTFCQDCYVKTSRERLKTLIDECQNILKVKK